MLRLLMPVALLALSACAEAPPNSSAAALQAAPNATGGVPATLEVIWPCLNSTLVSKGPSSFKTDILVDGVSAGTAGACSHSSVTISGTAHHIRLRSSIIDIGALVGNVGPAFAVTPGQRLYLLAQASQSGITLLEIDAARAEAEIKAIDSNR